MIEKALQDNLGRSLGLATKAFKKRMGRNFLQAGCDLTTEQGIVLIHLHHSEGMTQQEITDLLECDKTNTTRLIDALENREMVRRVEDMSDRRRKKIYLTDRGGRMYGKIKQVALKTQKQALGEIGAKEVQTCREVLLKIQANLLEG